ncbi:MAG: transposase [Oscillospiraceae bacterium]|nr:transposase [Oscillospiraceae bacterium]
MELPQRKRTRLPGYDYSLPGAYFVTVCTHERKCVLSEIAVGADAFGGPQTVLTHAGKVVEKYILSTENIPGVHVDKYVIMPNHIHLILRVEEAAGPPRASAPTTAAVPSAVSGLKRLANRELGKNIWQRSYHDHIIRGEDDYREIWNYIDTNPAKWCEDCFYPNP